MKSFISLFFLACALATQPTNAQEFRADLGSVAAGTCSKVTWNRSNSAKVPIPTTSYLDAKVKMEAIVVGGSGTTRENQILAQCTNAAITTVGLPSSKYQIGRTAIALDESIRTCATRLEPRLPLYEVQIRHETICGQP